jgi:hypothetical protein
LQKWKTIFIKRFTTVVGFFTTNRKKLGLYFSDISTIFYEFSNFSKTVLLFETRFYRQIPGIPVSIANRSPVHEKHPRKNEGDAM